MAMVRRALLVVLAGLVVGAVPAHAGVLGGACVGPPSVSAVNQYCENVPAATGGKPAAPGSPAVAATLTPRIARQIASTPHQSPARKLLTLPAAGPTHPLQGSVQAGSGSGVPLLLILVLIAIAVALIGTAIQRRRQRLRSSQALS